mgnify:CR=1 FL=1
MGKEERYILNICLFYIINVFGDGIVIKFTISNGLFFRIKINILEVALSLTTKFSIIKNRFQIKHMWALMMYFLMISIFNYIFIKNDLAEHFSFNGIKWRCIA